MAVILKYLLSRIASSSGASRRGLLHFEEAHGEATLGEPNDLWRNGAKDEIIPHLDRQTAEHHGTRGRDIGNAAELLAGRVGDRGIRIYWREAWMIANTGCRRKGRGPYRATIGAKNISALGMRDKGYFGEERYWRTAASGREADPKAPALVIRIASARTDDLVRPS